MAKEILGSGWKFPVSTAKDGSIILSSREEKIKQSIRIILGTAKGERVMRPDFGCDIHDFAFSVINTSTLTLMKSAVKEALILWEPRIDVLSIRASTDRLADGAIDFSIDYQVRTTNVPYNLVYPFYLKSEGGEL
jgi:phage baseplate assembly protein W